MGVSKFFVLIGITVLMQSSYSAPPPSVCVCSREYLPICGTDDVTYQNECLFECEKKHNKNLGIQFYGECDDENQEGKECVCSRVLAPVCGFDGTKYTTYANQCKFDCAKKSNKNLVMVHQGECNEVHILAVLAEEEICPCTDEYFPVCGSDNQIYPNQCMLNCEIRKKGDLTLKYIGECGERIDIPEDIEYQNLEGETCVCTRVFAPVCGSDSRTYDNTCLFNCAKKSNKNLKVKHQGEC